MFKVGNQDSVGSRFSTENRTPASTSKKSLFSIETIKKKIFMPSAPSFTKTVVTIAKSELPLMIVVGALSPWLSEAYDKLKSPSPKPISNDHQLNHTGNNPIVHAYREEEEASYITCNGTEMALSSDQETTSSSNKTRDLLSDINF